MVGFTTTGICALDGWTLEPMWKWRWRANLIAIPEPQLPVLSPSFCKRTVQWIQRLKQNMKTRITVGFDSVIPHLTRYALKQGDAEISKWSTVAEERIQWFSVVLYYTNMMALHSSMIIDMQTETSDVIYNCDIIPILCWALSVVWSIFDTHDVSAVVATPVFRPFYYFVSGSWRISAVIKNIPGLIPSLLILKNSKINK
jgi:hypothetical protein